MRRYRASRIVGLVFVGLVTAGSLGLVLGLVVMWLWNAIMPTVFGLPTIGYWQAVGLFILAHLLFKGPGHHDHHNHHKPGHVFSSHRHPGDECREKVKAWLNGEKASSDQERATQEDPAT